MNVRLVLLRHTRPAVGTGICHGRADLALAPSWRRDIAECLATVPMVTRVLTSPSIRCRALARAIGERDHVPIQVDDRLQELDFGEWEGRAWSEIPREGLDRWAADLLDYAPGDGESLRALWARVAQWREEVLEAYEGDVVVVSHHGPIRALFAQAQGRPLERMLTQRIAWGGSLCVELGTAARPGWQQPAVFSLASGR